MITLVAKHGLPDERKPVDVRVAGIWIEDNVMPSGGVVEEAAQSAAASMVEVDMVEVDTELEEIKARLGGAFVDLVQYLLVRMPK